MKHLARLDGQNGFNLERLMAATSLEAWDKELLPLYGYDSIEEMMDHVDSVDGVTKLDFPCIFINSDDDPVCPSSRFLEDTKLRERPNVIIVATPHGGHIGWQEGLFFASECRWISDSCTEYVEAILAERGNCTPPPATSSPPLRESAEETECRMLAELLRDLPPGFDAAKVEAIANQMFESADTDQSGALDQDEVVLFMTKMAHEQCEVMMAAAPSETRAALTLAKMAEQKEAIVAGIPAHVQAMSGELPFPWKPSRAKLCLLSFATMRIGQDCTPCKGSLLRQDSRKEEADFWAVGPP